MTPAPDPPAGAAVPTPGRLFVLSGPSAVGKSTVMARLRVLEPELWLSVSATTRTPRPGERDGFSYFFVSRERFAELVDGGEMLEWAEFAGNCYGTPAGPVAQRLADGQNVLLEIDVKGARQVRAKLGPLGAGGPMLIFLAPPSYEELARRLVGRGTEPEPVRAARLAAARAELAAEPEFDRTIVNHDVEAATAELVALTSRSGADQPS